MRLLLLAAALVTAPAVFAQDAADLAQRITHPDARLLSADEVAASGLDAEGPVWFVPVEGPEAVPSLGYDLPARASEKEEGIGILIGILVPGGGQFYAGDTDKGLKILGLGYGVFFGSIILASALDVWELSLLGYAGLLGATIYGILQTPDDVRAANARNGFALAPSVVRTGEGYAGGLTLRAAF